MPKAKGASVRINSAVQVHEAILSDQIRPTAFKPAEDPRVMADYDRTILSHYHLANPYPTEWPAEKDQSDASDEDLPSPLKAQLNVPLRRSKSKFSALERSSIGRRSLVPGSQKTRDGLENLVQTDEADPLGGYDSVVRVLRDRGLPVESELHLRACGAASLVRRTLC